MRKMSEKSVFLGTYFDRDAVLRLARVASILAWVILAVYGVQFCFSIFTFILQFVRGFMVGFGLTDILQQVLFLIEQPFRGVVYFVVLQAAGKVLLIFMDIEDNTRRQASNPK